MPSSWSGNPCASTQTPEISCGKQDREGVQQIKQHRNSPEDLLLQAPGRTVKITWLAGWLAGKHRHQLSGHLKSSQSSTHEHRLTLLELLNFQEN